MGLRHPLVAYPFNRIFSKSVAPQSSNQVTQCKISQFVIFRICRDFFFRFLSTCKISQCVIIRLVAIVLSPSCSLYFSLPNSFSRSPTLTPTLLYVCACVCVYVCTNVYTWLPSDAWICAIRRLQYVAVCVLQFVAVCCSVNTCLHSMHAYVLHGASNTCNSWSTVMQRVAACCSVCVCVCVRVYECTYMAALRCMNVCYTAPPVCCSVLQCVAVCCSVL